MSVLTTNRHCALEAIVADIHNEGPKSSNHEDCTTVDQGSSGRTVDTRQPAYD